jgi:hypothetical protein
MSLVTHHEEHEEHEGEERKNGKEGENIMFFISRKIIFFIFASCSLLRDLRVLRGASTGLGRMRAR